MGTGKACFLPPQFLLLFSSWGRAKETLSIHSDTETETSSRSEGRKVLLCPRADWLVAIQLGDGVCSFGATHRTSM